RKSKLSSESRSFMGECSSAAGRGAHRADHRVASDLEDVGTRNSPRTGVDMSAPPSVGLCCEHGWPDQAALHHAGSSIARQVVFPRRDQSRTPVATNGT